MLRENEEKSFLEESFFFVMKAAKDMSKEVCGSFINRDTLPCPFLQGIRRI